MIPATSNGRFQVTLAAAASLYPSAVQHTPPRIPAVGSGGWANTIIVAEIDHDQMHWLEPRDLEVEVEQMSFEVNDQSRPSISSPHREGPAVLFGDGEVYRLSPDVSPETVRAMLTVAGGEGIDRGELIEAGLLGR